MHLTRKIDVGSRIITIGDLRRFAKILDDEASADPNTSFRTAYEVSFADELSVVGNADEVFIEEELHRPSRPVQVEMRLHRGWSSSNRYIRIDLRAGDVAYGNAILVGSDDAQWMNANVTALRDALDKVTLQTSWVKKHPTLLLNLLALGIGSAWDVVCFAIALIISHGLPSVGRQIDALPTPRWMFVLGAIHASPVGVWIYRWFWGHFFAFRVRPWILSAWPNVEFDFGNPFLRPINKRRQLQTLWTLVILPVLLAALYDVLRKALL